MPLRSFARFDVFVAALDFTNSGASSSLRHMAQLGVMMSVLGALCSLGNQWLGEKSTANGGEMVYPSLKRTAKAPENGWFEDNFPFRMPFFSGAMLVLGSVAIFLFQLGNVNHTLY